jgi:hypothetical protein
MTDSRLNTTLHQTLETLAATPAGFSASDVTGHAPEQVRRAAQALVAAGRLHRATVGTRRVRYFATADGAQAFLKTQPSTAPSRALTSMRSKARWSADEPGIITSKTRITKAPPLPRDVLRTNTFPMY